MKYIFCPFCGSKYKKVSNNFANCLDCKKTFYENSKPCSSGIIVNNKNEVLLGLRSINPKIGTWDIPGGFLENGEDPIEGLRRELKEELNISVTNIKPFFICTDDYEYQGEKYKTLNLFYLCSISTGKIKPMDDISKIGWFNICQLPENLAFNNTLLVLNKLREILRENSLDTFRMKKYDNL